MGLSPHDITAYVFMVRRFGDGAEGVHSSVGNMAKQTNMGRTRFFAAINNLLERNMIAISSQVSGHTTIYDLIDKDEWVQPVHEVNTPRSRGEHPPVHEVNTKEIPLKINTQKENPPIVPQATPPELVQSPNGDELATSSQDDDVNKYGAAWNELRGALPGILLPLSDSRQRAVGRLVKKHGERSYEMFRAAVQAVARNDFWQKRRYGFDNLVPNKVERYAEQWAHSGSLTGADVKLLTRAQRIAAALGDDE